MKNSELVFIGIKGSVVGLDRTTGAEVWTTDLKGSGFVNVVLAGGKLYATTYGEVFCLDPLMGNTLWHNRLKGFGTGLAAIATENNQPGELMAVVAEEELRRQQFMAAAAASGSATAGSS